VRYCVADLEHPLLWVTSGLAEFWSLTIDERKCLLEVAIDEARKHNPDILIQSCTASMSAKDCLELTIPAARPGRNVIAEGYTDRCTVCVYPMLAGWCGRCVQPDGRPY